MPRVDPFVELEEVLNALEHREKYFKLETYEPYDFQRDFHHARDDDGKLAMERALVAANQSGKTICGGAEAAMHATGLYPDWWDGHRIGKPNIGMCGSNTDQRTRDGVQAKLLGEPGLSEEWGAGYIPKEMLLGGTKKSGVPNMYDTVNVKHVTGGTSRILLRTYEQGPEKHMGYKIDWGWLDEEPPQRIWEQYRRGTFASKGFLFMTFTPESGVTDVVYQFMHDIKPGQAMVRATWDDAPHMDSETQEALLARMAPHEREMRSRGIPTVGSGLVFPVEDEVLKVDPFQIPAHWPRINGLDFGWDHPTAVAFCALDLDTDTFYIYGEYREKKALTSVVADAIRARGEWIPVAWPHDGLEADKSSGIPLATMYRDRYRVNMLPKCFTNPPGPGQVEGQGGQGVEVGLHAMLQAMEEGRFKVFSNTRFFFEEKSSYHRRQQDGRVALVKQRDDFICAARYAYQSRRFATTRPVEMPRRRRARGERNW